MYYLNFWTLRCQWYEWLSTVNLLIINPTNLDKMNVKTYFLRKYSLQSKYTFFYFSCIKNKLDNRLNFPFSKQNCFLICWHNDKTVLLLGTNVKSLWQINVFASVNMIWKEVWLQWKQILKFLADLSWKLVTFSVCLSISVRSSVTFYIFIFGTTGLIPTKLDTKHS